MVTEAGTGLYAFPFKPGQRVIELGGGDRPYVRPNVDVRAGLTVDIVANFEQALPIQTEEWDGIICQYALEHISYKKVRGFMAETFRILKPGGLAVFITANLLEQCRQVVETPPDRWNDDLPCMIFGSLDYEENSHRAGWSPEYAISCFQAIGYYEVKVLPHPACKTDMIIEARKSAAEITTSL